MSNENAVRDFANGTVHGLPIPDLHVEMLCISHFPTENRSVAHYRASIPNTISNVEITSVDGQQVAKQVASTVYTEIGQWQPNFDYAGGDIVVEAWACVKSALQIVDPVVATAEVAQ